MHAGLTSRVLVKLAEVASTAPQVMLVITTAILAMADLCWDRLAELVGISQLGPKLSTREGSDTCESLCQTLDVDMLMSSLYLMIIVDANVDMTAFLPSHASTAILPHLSTQHRARPPCSLQAKHRTT